MENTIKKKKTFFQSVAEIFFAIYVITLYVFVDKGGTLALSQLSFIAFAGMTVLVILQRYRFHLGKNVMLVYIAFTWFFTTYFWAYNEYMAYGKIKTMWQLFLLFFLTYNLFREEEDAHKKFLKTLYIAGIALIGYSLYTYGIGHTLDVLKSAARSHKRLGAEINQANTFGILNATTVIIAFYYLFYTKRYKLLHIAVIAFAFLFSMASGSRTSLLMICIGVIFLIYKKYGIRQIYKIVAIGAVISIVFLAVIQLPIFEFINERMQQSLEVITGDGRGDNSSRVRLDMIKDGLTIFKDRVLRGYGADNYRLLSRYRTYSHNNFVEMLVDFGLIGFVLYYLIYWKAFRNLSTIKSNEGKVLLCIFLVRFMMELVTVPYYDKVQWVLFAFFLIRPAENKEKEEEEDEHEILAGKAEKSDH